MKTPKLNIIMKLLISTRVIVKNNANNNVNKIDDNDHYNNANTVIISKINDNNNNTENCNHYIAFIHLLCNEGWQRFFPSSSIFSLLLKRLFVATALIMKIIISIEIIIIPS